MFSKIDDKSSVKKIKVANVNDTSTCMYGIIFGL